MNGSWSLRSSSLAGSSVFSSGVIPEGSIGDRVKPSRISSTPNLRSLVPKSSDIAPLFMRPNAVRSDSSEPIRPRFKPARRQSAPPAFLSLEVSTSIVLPTRPLRSKFHESVKTGVITTSIVDPPHLSHSRHRHSRSVPSVNWMTSNTFDEVPRFSRLSLSAPHIILPVSAKAHRRRKSLQPSAAEQSSLPISLQVLLPINRKRISDATISTIRPFNREGSMDGSEENADRGNTSVTEHRNNDQYQGLTSSSVPMSELYDDEDEGQFVISKRPITSLFSPGSLELEFGIITEEGVNKGVMLVSPRSERSFASKRGQTYSIMIPSVPVDVELETPLVESHHSRTLSQWSTRSTFAARSRKNSMASRNRKVVRQSRSMTSVKAHGRAVSNADSVLFASIPLTRDKHTKGLSFLSLSSDGSDCDAIDDDTPPVPTVPDYVHAHKRSIDTFSVCSDEIRDAEELLMDVLTSTTTVRRSRPTSIPIPDSAYEFTAQPQHIITPKPSRSKTEKLRSFWPPSVIAPPPSSVLPSPPSPSTLSPVSPASSVFPRTPNVHLPALPMPSRPRPRSKADEAILLLGLNGETYSSNSMPATPTALDFPSPPSGITKTKRFWGTMDYDRRSSIGPSKARKLLGMDESDEPQVGSFLSVDGAAEIMAAKAASISKPKVKAVFTVDVDSPRPSVSSSFRGTLKSGDVESVKKETSSKGGVKKFLKAITGGRNGGKKHVPIVKKA
uniref:Uncharacterized protein n=1 Tax=Moniliophthora roreri TaxID=221103 RepID=A0A0W0ETM5_MONRR